jgi:hypothetical protein
MKKKALLFLAFVPALALLAYEDYPLKTWPHSEGQVTNAVVIPNAPPQCLLVVTFKYPADGREYLGAATLGSWTRYKDPKCSQLAQMTYTVGSRHKILFNPNDRTQLIIDAHKNERFWPGILITGLAVIFIAVGLFVQ